MNPKIFFGELKRRNVYKVAVTDVVRLLGATPIMPALLRLDPFWDPLRSDPRFQKLCEEKQP